MHADALKLLWYARQAADRIARFTADKAFTDYEADEMPRSAVERRFEILGQAFHRLSRLEPSFSDRIPGLARMSLSETG